MLGHSSLGNLHLGLGTPDNGGGSSTVTGSFTADAVLKKTISGSFTADAYLSAAASTVAGSFTADSVLLKTTSGSFTADAVFRKIISGSFTADSYITLPITTYSGSFTADALLAAAPAIEALFGVQKVKTDATTGTIVLEAVKTVELRAGDSIYVQTLVDHDTASTFDIVGDTASARTYFSIHKVGSLPPA